MPEGYKLEKNANGQLSLINPEGTEVVEPIILSYGFDADNFIACVKPDDTHLMEHLRKVTDPKRFQAVNFRSGTAMHFINKKQWDDFVKLVPAVGTVKLNQIGTETCP